MSWNSPSDRDRAVQKLSQETRVWSIITRIKKKYSLNFSFHRCQQKIKECAATAANDGNIAAASMRSGADGPMDREARQNHMESARKELAKIKLLRERQFVTIEDAKAALADIDKQFK